MHQKQWWRTVLGVAAGNALLAFGINTFYLSADLAVGGSTGVGVLLYRLFGLDASLTVLLINVSLLVAGWLVVGKEFVLSSVFGSLIYPLFLKIFSLLPSMAGFVEDRLTSSVCAGILVGAGVGLVVRVGSSTGGTDTLAVILQKSLHIPVVPVKLIADYGVMALIFLLVGADSIIYSCLALAVETIVMNRIILLGTSQLQLLIVTDHPEEIRQALLQKWDVGVTMLQGETGLRRTQCQLVLCVIPNRKLFHIKECIYQLDPEAFMTVAEVKEVRGQGFTRERIPQPNPVRLAGLEHPSI